MTGTVGVPATSSTVASRYWGLYCSMADTKEFVYEPMRGPMRKVEFKPQSDGGFVRAEAIWNGC